MSIYGCIILDRKTGHVDRTRCGILTDQEIQDFIHIINGEDNYYSCYDLMWYVRYMHPMVFIFVCNRYITDDQLKEISEKI